jgi:hypothetical protein
MAKWIWLQDPSDTPNRYALFRRSFSAPEGKRCGRALLHASAGHFYHVFLNGRPGGRGPDRCYFREKIYHTYDVSRLLRKGENVLAIEVHYLGQNTGNLMERQAAGPAGCLAQLEFDGKAILWSDHHWKVLENPAYAARTEPPSMHREWREVFHADKAIVNWTRCGFNDSAWPAVRVVAPAQGGPWTKLVAKETPELSADVLRPLNLYPTNDGGIDGCEYDAPRLYNCISAKPERVSGAVSVWNDRQERQELLFDMGRVVAGYPRLEIARSLGGSIKVYYGDSLSLIHWDTIHLGKSALTWTPFTARGGRYFKLVIIGARNPVTIRSVRWIRTNYPVEHRGSFTSSDPALNAIWRMCALTADTCAMEHFTDCVGREQVLWMMDFRFQALQHYYYFGDTALARKCFRQFAALQLDNGFILGYGPSCRGKETLLSGDGGHRKAYDWFNFNFYFLLAVQEYFQYTQDRAFLREMYPVCKRAMDYYARHERDGFAALGEVGGSNHIDWGYKGSQKSPQTHYSFSQAMYYGAIQAQSSMSASLGRKAESTALKSKAARLEQRILKVFLAPRTGLMCDCFVAGKRVDCKTIYPHVAALRFLDRLPEKARQKSLQILVQRQATLPRTGMGIGLMAEALFRHNEPKAAVRLIRDYYGAILDAGLRQVPEFFDMAATPGADCRYQPAYSRCHSYASLAGALLQKNLLGATVEGKTVRLSPRFAGLAHAAGVVPTPAGDVSISWVRGPRGLEVRVVAPRMVRIRFEPCDSNETVQFHIERIRAPHSMPERSSVSRLNSPKGTL